MGLLYNSDLTMDWSGAGHQLTASGIGWRGGGDWMKGEAIEAEAMRRMHEPKTAPGYSCQPPPRGLRTLCYVVNR